MKRRLTVCVLMCAVVALLAGSAALGQKPTQAEIPSGPAGKSHIGHLYLFEKDPVTWEIIDGGARGKMKYNLEGYEFDFVFNGHGLEQGLDYTLIYYPDPWPGDGLICLGEGTFDFDGNLHIKNTIDTGSLPAMGDENYPAYRRTVMRTVAARSPSSVNTTKYCPLATGAPTALRPFHETACSPAPEAGSTSDETRRPMTS